MIGLILSFVIVGIALAAPAPFLKDRRARRSLLLLSGLVFGILGLTVAMQAERSTPLNVSIFVGVIGLFWVAGRFEAS